MPLLKWKPEYSVNKAELDNHHIWLFNSLNSAYENVMNSSGVNGIISVVDELSEYMKSHFFAEEQMGLMLISRNTDSLRRILRS